MPPIGCLISFLRRYRKAVRRTMLHAKKTIGNQKSLKRSIPCLRSVSKRYAAVLTVFPEDKQTEAPSGRQIAEAIRTHSRRGAVQLLLPKERSLLVLDAEDLYMTVYQPQPALLSLLRTEAEKRNLFLWRHPD